MGEKLKIMPPNCFMVMIVLNIILHYVFPIKKVVSPPYNYLGILLIVLGIYLNLYVYFVYKKEKNTMEPNEVPQVLITSGVFKISRNPLYLGMALILFGEAILLGSIITFLFPLLFIIMTNMWTIPLEEKNLEKKFGRKYLDYKRKVRKWI